MPSVGTASLDLVVDKQQVGRSITGAIDSQRTSVFSSAKRLAGVFVGGFAAVQGIKFFKGAIEEAREAAQVTREVNAAIAATKGVANISAAGIDQLATRLSNLTGIDDEMIATGEKVLLSFLNVKNAAGAGNDIFTQATKAAVDMSAFLKQDLQSSITAIGKALNDPAKGAAALAKSGSLAKADLEKLQEMAKKGTPLLEQQKFVLAALNQQYAGSAEAAADPMKKLGVIWANLQETVGGLFLPTISKAATWLGDNLPKAVEKTKKGVADLRDKLAPFAEKVHELFDGFAKSPIAAFVEKLKALAQPVGVAAAAIVGFGLVLGALAPVFAILTSPITLTIAGIAAVAAGVIYAYTHFQTFRDVVGKVASYIVEQAGKVVDWFQRMWPQISEAFSHVVNFIQLLWKQWGDDIMHVAMAIFGFVKETIQNALQVVRGIIQTVLAVINGDWGKAWDGIKQILGGVWKQIWTIVGSALDVLKGLFGGIGSTIGDVWGALWGGMKSVVDNIWVGIQNSVRSGINFIIDAINGLIKAYNLLPGHKDIAPIAHLLAVSHDKVDTKKQKDTGQYLVGNAYADGGWVTAPKGQAQLAIVHGGEYVLSNSMIEQMSRGGAPGMAASVTINMPNYVGDPEAISEAIVGEMSRAMRQYADART